MNPVTNSTLNLEDGFHLVAQVWNVSDEFSEQNRTRSTETLQRFIRRLAVTGVNAWSQVTAADCRRFIHAHTQTGQPPELATQHARRTVLRMALRTLRSRGHDIGDATLDISLPPRSNRIARPLTDDEISLCRAASRLSGPPTLRRAVTWALAEATAVTSEIPQVRIRDLDDPESPTRVRLAGNHRHDPRWGVLTDWGATILTRHVTFLLDRGITREASLTYRGKFDPSQDKAQASSCNAVANILTTAGLASQPDVRPASIRGWIGRSLYDRGHSLQDVALALGNRSLDATAEAIALDWRTTTTEEIAS